MSTIKNSIYLAEHIQERLDLECTRYGMSRSAFISMLIVMHDQQVQSINNLAEFKETLEKIEILALDKK